MNNNIYHFQPIPLETLYRVSTNFVPISTPPPVFSPSPQTWFFSYTGRELRNETTRIQLTAIEALLIRTLILSTERICSKQELISGIGKDLHSYSGLEMCLSRLQNKFRDSFDERLFRSVRNRGYCLVQDVKIML
ncbi:winged helix-turn-helix domain-containing protein [Pseudomonas helleri]|uniref:winged helix-turn-helix domain-containing protein n=1 Tax=Pseudomonas helleri TaxID=1608996 RepID=UPI003A0FC9D3